MPSFLRSSRRSQQLHPTNASVKLENDEALEKGQPSSSKRSFFKRLLRRSSTPVTSAGSKLQKATVMQSPEPQPQVQQIQSSEKLPSPMHNKPLPPPPTSGTDEEPPAKASVKLDRIISPLASADLRKLFSGAPQFFARSRGHGTGAPHPSIAYPFDTESGIRDLSDHIRIPEAYRCVTAWPHTSLQSHQDHYIKKENTEKSKPRFIPFCRERPNMLSMQGIERGTFGYQAALELGVADALQSEKEASHKLGPRQISEERRRFLHGKDGLRPLTDSALVEKLISVSEIYHNSAQSNRPTVELYTDLFTQTLFPPSRVTDSEDPYSLQVQIEVLIEVLAAKGVWVDFSLVESRIRLGQILWGIDELENEDDLEGSEGLLKEPNTQKYWLLLQILLSSELLLRLDQVSKDVDQGTADVRPEELQLFEKGATPSIRWSLIMARTWLENIRIQDPIKASPKEKKAPSGWLASLTSVPTPGVASIETLDNYHFEGIHQTRQLEGLVHFARALRWPNFDALLSKIKANGINIAESTGNTPAGTPRSVSTQRSSSYFSRRPSVRRGVSINNRLSAIVRPSGWLSNSYITGFVLPGESLSHLLISTLLENDELAVSRLGEEANLYGGFIYSGKSFWSTSCIVGRILAAGKNASECMGWISSDIIPRGLQEGWIDLDVEMVDEADSSGKESKPRIWRKTSVERRGHIIGGADLDSVLPGDFILPSDESIQIGLAVNLESLDLFAAVDSLPETPNNETETPLSDLNETPVIKTYNAMMRFSVQADGEDLKEVNLSLSKDVFFLTAHPCITSQSTEVLKSPNSPSFTHLKGKQIHGSSGHPLHKAFTYTKLPLNELISTSPSTPFSTLLSQPNSQSRSRSASPNLSQQSSTHTTSSHIPKVLIVDCTDSTMSSFPPRNPNTPEGEKRDFVQHGGQKFGSDIEILARAVCSERGWNAVVSRRGRGCLACAVREAGSVGWKVVLRVA